MQKHHSLGFIKVTMPNDKTAYVRSKFIEAVLQADKNVDGVVSTIVTESGGRLMAKTMTGAIISQIEDIPPELR